MLRDFFIPANFAEPITQLRQHESYAHSGVDYEAAQLSVEWLAEFATKFNRPAFGFKLGSKAWQQRAIAAWCQVARDWQTMKFRGAKSVLEVLVATTGLSQKMLKEALYNHFCVFSENILNDWLRRVKRGRDKNAEHKTAHPALAFLVAAGNIPGVAIQPMAQLSLLGIPAIIKNASAEPFLLPAILTTLANYDAEIAARIAAFTWPRSATALTETLMQLNPALVAFGDDGTIAHFAQNKKNFAGFGDRFSLALVSLGQARSRLRRLAYDLCLYEQMGCLSPQAILLLADDWKKAGDFCRQLAKTMEKMCRQLPIGKRTPEQHAAIQQWRGSFTARRAAGEKVILLTGDGTDWTVAAAEHFDLSERVAYRFARVWPVYSMEAAMGILRQYGPQLQALALGFSYEDLQQIAQDFPELDDGFPRLLRTLPGYMQKPSFGWMHIYDEWQRLTLGLRPKTKFKEGRV
jgi:hypothetical protein